MSWFGKLFGDSSPRNDAAATHPPLPAGVEQFRPAGGQSVFRATAHAVEKLPQTGAAIIRTGAASSLISQADAEQKAAAAAQRHLRGAVSGTRDAHDEYAYAVDRRLEPVIEVLGDASNPAAQVTVNRYGALVVNARAALFADVDTRADDHAAEEPGANERAAARLAAVVAADPELGFRVYRTHNGWRYLCTSALYDPAADETRALLEALGVDARYVLLCRAQRCFRARLTPKPWRIGDASLRLRPLQSVTRKRLEKYLKRAAPFATARFASSVGRTDTTHPELQLIVEHHDLWCAVDSGKPLA